jgi:hypothetical protein
VDQLARDAAIGFKSGNTTSGNTKLANTSGNGG